MGCPAGCCGSCVFTGRPDHLSAGLDACRINDDPEVKNTYKEMVVERGYAPGGVCGKYQLNPAVFDPNA